MYIYLILYSMIILKFPIRLLILLLQRINTHRLSFPPRVKCGIICGRHPVENWMPDQARHDGVGYLVLSLILFFEQRRRRLRGERGGSLERGGGGGYGGEPPALLSPPRPASPRRPDPQAAGLRALVRARSARRRQGRRNPGRSSRCPPVRSGGPRRRERRREP